MISRMITSTYLLSFVLVLGMHFWYAKKSHLGVGSKYGTLARPVTISDGVELIGIEDEGIQRYLGVPYAQASRWEAPEPYPYPEGPLKCFRYGAQCYQADDQVSDFQRAYNTFLNYEHREECLNLNIASPRTAKAGDKYPVMVYLHAGNFACGGNAEVANNPLNWVASEQNLIVVSPNYRLGALGWAYNPAFPGRAKGNFGLLDAIEALRWVKRNIEAFGGDPNNIALVGHSAGAMMGTYLVEILARDEYRAEGQLVHKMILASGTHLLMPLKTPVVALDTFRRLAKDLGCVGETTDDLTESMESWRPADGSCLLPTGLRTKYKRVWGPVEDGRLIRRHFSDILRDYQSRILQIPILLTMMEDDGSIFVPKAITSLVNYEDFPKIVRRMVPTVAAEDFLTIKAVYDDIARTHGNWSATNALLTDALFYMPMQKLQAGLQSLGASIVHYTVKGANSVAHWLPSTAGGERRGVALAGTHDLYYFHYTDHILLFNATVPEDRSMGGLLQRQPEERSAFLRALYVSFMVEGLAAALVRGCCCREPKIELGMVEAWARVTDRDVPVNWELAGVTLPEDR